MNYFIRLLVNADNAIDVAHAERTPLPFLSSMVEDCISEGKSVQEGGAVYNFTGPQGFGVANMADSLYTIKKLVFEEKRFTMAELIEAVDHNFGHGVERHMAEKVVAKVSAALAQQGKTMSEAEKEAMKASLMADRPEAAKYKKILDAIEELPKFGNDVPEVDYFAREVAYTYTKPIEKYENPRGGRYQAGLYPVSANVPLGAQDGRFAGRALCQYAGGGRRFADRPGGIRTVRPPRPIPSPSSITTLPPTARCTIRNSIRPRLREERGFIISSR